ncbi:methylmalonyl-CoA mutase [Paraburkholderia ginsengisoli]|uniref:Methylmalonyl-CoA mutase n=1 Tax=Paraburkholderia ginsengisoli TaxID=311231 RepID=A0A7T4T9B0_9BURK|nr:methylmalonyl-CoA mutase [Paraburkholderia ginsengisoli]QQC64308.1 methylmalonyl-CoA mutase [Paraburkholderia ginsengisoli]
MTDCSKTGNPALSTKKILEREIDEVPLKPLYTAADTAGLPFQDSLPGAEPYLRGPYETMYTSRPWTIRQYAGFSTAKESNAFYRDALRGGVDGISVAFDLPTHRGYDSDHSRAAADVGLAGVAIDSVEDMKTLFDDIPLDKISVSMTMNGAVLPIMACFIVAAEEQGVSQDALTGTIQNDILKEFIVRNTYIYPVQPSIRITTDTMRYCTENLPKFNTISISGYHMQEAGASPQLELALTLANAREYVRAAVGCGLNVDDFAGRLSFFFAIGMNFYHEIAKLRAARQLWFGLLGEFNPKSERSRILRTHCQTSGWSLTEQDPYNNVVRTTIEAMAAVFGGTQSLHTNSLDEAIALPSEFSARIARNTQLIIREETRIPEVVDPWAGSYMMESLTQQMASQALQIIEEIDQLGGVIEAINSGWVKRKISHDAAKKQSRIDSGADMIVGVNKYKHVGNEIKNEIRKIDNSEVLNEQLQKLSRLKRTRDQRAVDNALSALAHAAQCQHDAVGRPNLLWLAIRAARVRATVGEISSALEGAWGRHNVKMEVLPGVYELEFQNDQQWLELKQNIAEFSDITRHPPRILLSKLGQDGHDRGIGVVAGALSDLGFEVITGALFATVEDVTRLALSRDVHAVGISSLTAAHRVLIPDLVANLKQHCSHSIPVFVGGVIPVADYDTLYRNGVSGIFGPGTPIVESATAIFKAIRTSLGVRSSDPAPVTNDIAQASL